jgi:RimJ/RimL family protein N-acetyltransferase
MGQGLAGPRGAVTIRAATVDDAELVRALRLQALATHPTAFAADHDRTEADPPGAWAERIRRTEAGQEGVICVAATEDHLVGMAGLHRGHWPKIQHSATIWGVYVAPAWRGQGVAGALLEGCIDWARGQGITVVKLGVTATNIAAIRCYARSGFAVYGIDPQVILYDGAYYDELLMFRAV